MRVLLCTASYGRVCNSEEGGRVQVLQISSYIGRLDRCWLDTVSHERRTYTQEYNQSNVKSPDYRNLLLSYRVVAGEAKSKANFLYNSGSTALAEESRF